MTIKLFDNLADAYKVLSEDPFWALILNNQVVVYQRNNKKFIVKVYDKFGDYIGLIQEDCSISLEGENNDA
jgi:hypothetical protein